MTPPFTLVEGTKMTPATDDRTPDAGTKEDTCDNRGFSPFAGTKEDTHDNRLFSVCGD